MGRGIFLCLGSHPIKNGIHSTNNVVYILVLDRPDPPDLKKYYTKTKTSITVSWEPSFDGNSPILSYQIDYKTSAHPSTPVTILITAQNTSYKITELEPYTGYEVRVRARNALGMSDFSIETNVETAEDGEWENDLSVIFELILIFFIF